MLVRDRAGALAAALRRQRGLRALAASGRVRLRLPGGITAELMDGILLGSGEQIAGQGALPVRHHPALRPPGRQCRDDADGGSGTAPFRPEVALELVTVATWLDREAHRVRLESCDGVLASAWPSIPTFSPGQPLERARSGWWPEMPLSRSMTAPARSMARIFVWPSGGRAPARPSASSGAHIVAMVGPEPDSQPHQAPASSATSRAWREPGEWSKRWSWWSRSSVAVRSAWMLPVASDATSERGTADVEHRVDEGRRTRQSAARD